MTEMHETPPEVAQQESDTLPELTRWLENVEPGDSRYLALSDATAKYQIQGDLADYKGILGDRRDQLNVKHALLEETIRRREDDPESGGAYLAASEELRTLVEKKYWGTM